MAFSPGSPRAISCSSTGPSGARTSSPASASQRAPRATWDTCRSRGPAERSRRSRGWSDRARCSSTSTIRTRSCSRTLPSARRSEARASRLPTMASRSSYDMASRGVHRPPARAGDALPQPPPLPHAHGRGGAHTGGAQALGREPLLLPEVHPLEGRGNPVELPRGRGPAQVDTPHRRPRRHDRGNGRHRVLGAPRRGARRLAGRAAVGAARPPRGPLRGRRLRELRAPEAMDRVCRVVAHRAFRAGRDPCAARGARASLRVDRPRGARVLPRTARAGAPRRAVRARPCSRALPNARAAGGCRRGAPLQDGDAVGAARGNRARRRAAAGAGRLTRPRLVTGARPQYGDVREEHVLLVPEGAVRLNPTAAAVLELCDGERSVDEIVSTLSARYEGSDLRDDVQGLVDGLTQRGLVVDAAS